MKALDDVRRLVAVLPTLPGWLRMVGEKLGQLSDEITLLRRTPKEAFVVVFVEGLVDGRKMSMGKTVVLRSTASVLVQFFLQVPLADGRVTVFADLARVAVGGFVLGNRALVLDSYEDCCPLAIFDRASPGEVLRCQLSLRGAP